jgi:hypothetical protein
MKILDNDQVIQRAQEWALLHFNRQYNAMDKVLEGISVADQRRVYLCGQRIRAGMKPKVIPTLERRENEQRTVSRPEPGAPVDQGQVPVGTDRSDKRPRKTRGDSKHKK